MCKMGQSGPKTANNTTNLIGQEPLIFKQLLLTHLWSLQKMHWNTFLCVVNLSLFVPDTLEIECSLKTKLMFGIFWRWSYSQCNFRMADGEVDRLLWAPESILTCPGTLLPLNNLEMPAASLVPQHLLRPPLKFACTHMSFFSLV